MTALRHQTQLRTVNSSLGNPPDYISIPEHLKSRPVEHLTSKLAGRRRFPKRLSHLLQYAGIHLLGDLDGKRLSYFEEYRGCGKGTVRALRRLLLRALYPGVKSDPSALPVRMRDWRPPEPIIEVANAVCGLYLQDLPVSVRLEGILRALGIEKLGQLHGLPVRKLLVRPSCGRKTLAELRALLRRAEAGEFTLSQQEVASRTPADLLRQIDDLVSRLSEQDRAFLTLRFGGTGQAPQNYRQIGQQHGLTAGAVWHRLPCAIDWMRRQGSLRLRSLLHHVDSVCATSHAPLSPALVSTWQEHARPFRYSPQFYVRLIAKLRPDAGVFKEKPLTPTRSRAKRA